jgi:hypothetical protein
MATIELTLSKDYVPNWGLWEGIRELVQNAIDGEKEMGFKMSIHYTAGGTVVIHNEGGVLPREALLIGYSTKRGNSELIGKYGEGFKLGLLALVREGYDVTIRNGKETWIPCLERSEKFNSDVLKFKITTANNDADGLKIMVKGVSPENWESFKSKFLFLSPSKDILKTCYGDILTHADDRGKVYVKGIYIQRNDQLAYGYNFTDADIDRDRRLIDSYDMLDRTGSCWSQAFSQNESLQEKVFDMLLDSSADLKHFYYRAGSETMQKLAEMFKNKYGDDAIPVLNFAQATEIAHFGARGIVVQEKMVKMLTDAFGSYEKIKEKLSNSAYTMVSPSDLDNIEQQHLTKALRAISIAEPSFDLRKLNVVEFKDGKKLGLRVQDSGEMLLSKSILSDLSKTIEVLIHEYCHSHGPDGDKAFADACANCAARIIAALL